MRIQKNPNRLDSSPTTRRGILQGGLAVLVLGWTARSHAGPFDSLELDTRARVLYQGPITIPTPKSGSPTGLAGADIVAPQRGWIGIDWVISDKREITCMLLSGGQKMQLLQGNQPSGDPLMRIDIDGPETAGQNAQVGGGSYYVAFLNRGTTPATFLYRASFLPF